MKTTLLETWGNATTMNLNNIVLSNIKLSAYYKTLSEITEVHELIDEIYNSVDYLEPFTTGSIPSSCFCLLFKMWNMKLNGKQIRGFVDNKDSPYIRALGFLYLRYICKPDNIWAWFEEYLNDEQELNLTKGPRHKKITIGELCKMLLTEMKFCGTMLPRIPVPIARQIEKSIAELSKGEKDDGRSNYRSSDDRRRKSRSPDRRRRNRSPDDRRYRSRSPGSRRYHSRSPDSRKYSRRYSPNSRRDESPSRDRYGSNRDGERRSPSNQYKESRSIRRYD